MENINKLKKIIFYYKNTKLPNPIRETRVLKLVFRTIPCLKFWALGVRVSELESIIAEIKEKFQLSTEQISCLQKSDLDIPSFSH